MVGLLADENFNHEIVRGLLPRRPELDILAVPAVELAGAEDDAILECAAANERIVLSHDFSTMPSFAFRRIAAGMPMPGLFVTSVRYPIGSVIREILFLLECCEPAEFGGRVFYLPI